MVRHKVVCQLMAWLHAGLVATGMQFSKVSVDLKTKEGS